MQFQLKAYLIFTNAVIAGILAFLLATWVLVSLRVSLETTPHFVKLWYAVVITAGLCSAFIIPEDWLLNSTLVEIVLVFVIFKIKVSK